jgi:hypothetical protein
LYTPRPSWGMVLPSSIGITGEVINFALFLHAFLLTDTFVKKCWLATEVASQHFLYFTTKLVGCGPALD